MKNKACFFGAVLCVMGALIFLYPEFREWRTRSEVEDIRREFSRPQSYAEGQKPHEDFYEEIIHLDSFDSDSAVGYIEIPSIGCSLPLFIGASTEHLARGAAVMGNTSMPVGGESTNCVIAAHRGYMGSAYFRDINQIAAGDHVLITNPWETLTYEAISMEVVAPYEEEPLLIHEGEDMLTLVSCHPYMIGGGPDRIVVQCRRVETDNDGEFHKGDADMISDISTENISQKVTVSGSNGEAAFQISDTNDDEALMFAESLLRKLLPAVLVFMAILILIRNRKKNKITTEGENV